jgi:hypothetical protein
MRLRVEVLEARDVPAGNFIAMGSDPGGAGTASLVDADSGVARFTVTPFEVAAADGIAVNVAVGDVTGDRVADLIVAPGAGGGPLVKVFDGVTGREVRSFVLFDPNFRGGLTVAAGDVNLDGIADVIAGAGPGGGPAVAVIDGKTGTTLATFFAFDAGFGGGVRVAAGDVDGDGRADVVVAAGHGGGPHVKAFGIVAGSAPRELFSFFAYSPDFTGGVSVAAGDTDADGITDVVTGAGSGGAPHVKCFRGTDRLLVSSFYAADPGTRDGIAVSTVNAGNGAVCQILADTGTVVNQYTGAGTFVEVVYGPVGPVGPLGGPADAADNPAVIWSRVTLESIRAEGTPPPKAARAMAIVSAAVFDAVNSISPRYTPYHYGTVSPVGADPVAAALSAGAAALTALFPTQAAKVQSILVARLALIPDSQAKADGVAVGQAAAADVLAFRQNDGSATAQFAVTPGTDPGDWRPTPPANAAFLLPGWGTVTPFAIPAADQFAPGAPPALDSVTYAEALNEVKALGSATSTTRTAEQSQIAVFWRGGGGTVTPPGMSAEIAQQVIRRENLDLLDSARVLALVGLAVADAGIVAWDAKRDNDLWRPVTAIRAADTDGNDLTGADPAWSSFIATPPFPSYTSGHSTFSSAAAAVLQGLFGENYAFRFYSQDLPGVSRSFASFFDAANEAGFSRILGGIHYSFDNTAGLESGTEVGEYVVGNLLRPV